MGITLKGYRKDSSYSNDVTYSGFFRLRRDIAYMLSYDIGTWYGCMIECLHGDKEEQKKWEDGINKAINEYLDVHKKSMKKVIDFLFMPDTEGKISYGTCKLICGLIDAKNVDDREKFNNISYGYDGWGAKTCCGRNIYGIMHSCWINKRPMVWY